jgi:hypothetical protein
VVSGYKTVSQMYLMWLYVKYLTSIKHMLVCPSPVEVSGKLGSETVKGPTENENNNEDAETVDTLF